MNPTINIAIAEDHDIVRQGYLALFKGHPLINVLFDVTNGKELYSQLKTLKPDIILLDLEMPVMSGKEVLEKIQLKYPKIKIIIISATTREATILEYLKKGVGSFLYKNCKFDKLVEAIVSVHNNGVYYDDYISKILQKDFSIPEVSDPEFEFSEIDKNILRLIRDGLTSREIGEQLHLNNRSVEWHRSQMLKKTNFPNFTALTAYAIQKNLI